MSKLPLSSSNHHLHSLPRHMRCLLPSRRIGMKSWLTRAVLLVLLAFLATPSFAQIQTGEIHGRVTDASGAVLPGVSVTVEGRSLIQPEVTVTTETGAYSFPRIPVGTYAIRFDLAGFRQLLQLGIVIQYGFAAQINAKLEMSTVQETVTVSAASPVVDTKQTTTGATFTTEALQGIPSARDPWVLLEQTPGVVMNQQNVGGNK